MYVWYIVSFASQAEFRQSLGRLSVFYGNKSPVRLNAFVASLVSTTLNGNKLLHVFIYSTVLFSIPSGIYSFIRGAPCMQISDILLSLTLYLASPFYNAIAK